MSANSKLIVAKCPECENIFCEDVSILHNSRECPACKKVVMFIRYGNPHGSGSPHGNSGSHGGGWPSPVATDANMAVSAARFFANLIHFVNVVLTIIYTTSLIISIRHTHDYAAFLTNQGIAGLLTFFYFVLMLSLIVLCFFIVRAFANWFDGCTRLLAHCGMFLKF